MSTVYLTLPRGVERMTVDAARRLTASVLRANPRLTVDGWYIGRLPVVGRVDFDLEQLQTAVSFLRRFARRCKTFNSKALSYSLKHTAENWGRDSERSPYISNGTFILAALICGYKHQQCVHPAGINCVFDISIDRAARRFEWHLYGRDACA